MIKKNLSHHASGAVLCFLPGWQEIRAVQEKLEGNGHFSPDSHLILPCKKKQERIERLEKEVCSSFHFYSMTLFFLSFFQCTLVCQFQTSSWCSNALKWARERLSSPPMLLRPQSPSMTLSMWWIREPTKNRIMTHTQRSVFKHFI